MAVQKMSERHLVHNFSNFNRVSLSEIAEAKSRRIEEVVGAALPLKRDFGLCPFHSEKSPSLHIDRKRNIFHCFGCGAGGDTIAFVRRLRNLDFAAAVRELTNEDGLGPRYVPAQKPEAVQRAEAPSTAILALWRGATSPEIARYYLDSRGMALKSLPLALRGHRAVWCAETRERRPALLAAISGADGAITAIQRTWINEQLVYDGTISFPRGARCPDLSAGKKCLGPLEAGAVRLFVPGKILGLAEGVETSIAANKLFHIPVWATCGARRLGNVEMPDCVQRVVIFGDRGEAGEAAAAKAETAYRRRGYAAQCEFPDRAYGDFAEQVAA